MKKHLKNLRFIDVALAGALLAALAAPTLAVIPAPTLGTAANYTILDVNTRGAEQARSDFAAAFNYISNQPCAADATLQDLNNQRLTPGVYCFSSSTLFNGWWTLDAQGDPNAVFMFKLTNMFTVGDYSRVNLTGGAQPQNIFWLVNGPMRIGTGVRFAGTVLATGDITVSSENKIEGRLSSLGTVTVGPANTIVLPVSVAVPQPIQQPVVIVTSAQPATGRIIVQHADPNFALFVDGFRVTNGQPTMFLPGTHTVSVVNFSGAEYGSPTYGGDCTQNGLAAAITLNAGEQKVCTVSNIQALGTLPGLPNTGAGGAYMTLLNTIGLLLVAAFVWEEFTYKKLSLS